MSLRFQKRVRPFPGVRLNFSGGGLNVTVGVAGASVNIEPRGTALNLGLPGTGLSYRHILSPAQPEWLRAPSDPHRRLLRLAARRRLSRR